jgi:hypothetical protein
MRIGLLSACLVGGLASGTAWAEPGPIGTYLMDQKVSMFSFGMLRLELQLQRLQGELGGSFFSAHYDWDANRINLVAVFDYETLTKERCKEYVNQIKSRGAINPETGQSMFGDASIYANFFSDIGFDLKSKPEHIEAKLDKIIAIQVTLHESSFVDSDGISLRCSSDLVSSQIMYSE